MYREGMGLGPMGGGVAVLAVERNSFDAPGTRVDQHYLHFHDMNQYAIVGAFENSEQSHSS